MYKLQKAKQCSVNEKWFVVSKKNKYEFLRPSLTVEFSTGYIKQENVGYWDTEKEANKARKKFLRKQRLDNIDWYQEQFEKCVKVVVQSNTKNWHLCKLMQPKDFISIRDIKLESKVETYEQ